MTNRIPRNTKVTIKINANDTILDATLNEGFGPTDLWVYAFIEGTSYINIYKAREVTVTRKPDEEANVTSVGGERNVRVRTDGEGNVKLFITSPRGKTGATVDPADLIAALVAVGAIEG